MENPFVVTPATLHTDPMSERNGLPTFNAAIAGIDDPFAYFYLDLFSSHTIVWHINCTTDAIGAYPASTCEDEPTLTYNAFDNYTLPPVQSTFSYARFGGYVVSGNSYTSKLCFGTYNCKFVRLYSATQIHEDNWLYGIDGAYGILGAGPRSHIWEGFVDPETKKAYFSIELDNVSFYKDSNNNITFGAANDADYQGKSNLKTAASLLDYTYAVQNLSFGIVYQTDGVDSSEFFVDILGNQNYNARFATNFKGLGLPANIYEQFVGLFEYLTKGDVNCVNSQDGYCTLPGPCANYTAYVDYAFMLNFTDSDGTYMRVPLGAFAEQVLIGGGNSICNIHVNYLNPYQSQSGDIILGGMFFQEFFAVFENDYADRLDPMQSATIYVGRNALGNAYVGSEILPTGVNPFVPQPPPTPPTPDEGGIKAGWIVVLVLLCSVLLGLLGVALWKWKVAQSQLNARQAAPADTVPLVNHSGQVAETEDRPIGMD